MHRSLFSLFIMLLLFTPEHHAQYHGDTDSLHQMLERSRNDTTRCRILMELASVEHPADTVASMGYLEEGRQIAEQMDDKGCLGRSYEIQGDIHSHHGLYDLAVIEYDRAMAYYYEAGDARYYEALKDKGNVYLFQSEYSQAMNCYKTALDFFKRNDMVEGASRCLNNMGIIYKNRGQYVEALTVYDESIKYIDRENNPMQVAQGYINMGNVFVFLGSFERAMEYFNMAREIAEKEHSTKEVALCLLNSGVIQNKCGHYLEAEQSYKRALQAGKRLNDPVIISNSLINLGTNYASMGRPETGLEFVEQGLRIKEQLGDDRTISNCYIHMAEIYHHMGAYEHASEFFNRAIPVKEALDDQEGLVRSYLGLARLYTELERYGDADRMADMALDLASGISTLEHLNTGYGIKRVIAEARGDFQAAYRYAMDSQRFYDSLVNEKTSMAAMEMEFKHRSKVLAQENENLRLQSDLDQEMIMKRNIFIYSIAGLTILLLVGLFLVSQFLRRLRATSQKLEEKNMVITRQNVKLDALNRNKDRMMSIIAHDIRGTIGNQLTAIEVLHRIEGEDQPGIDRKKLLGNLKHSASYSLELLENLLHWSRLEGNEEHFIPEEINLNMVVSNCVSLFDEMARDKGVSVDYKPNGISMIRSDRVMLETIIRNLLSNAIKFSEKGGTVTISSEKDERGIVIRVEDRGIGMSEEQINKVMSNGGYTRRGTANEKGAGIGLALVREFTARHEGSLEIESKEGIGTVMTVSLPDST